MENKNQLTDFIANKCPICDGGGMVSAGFYLKPYLTSLPGCDGSSTNVSEQCRSCNGQGILWTKLESHGK